MRSVCLYWSDRHTGSASDSDQEYACYMHLRKVSIPFIYNFQWSNGINMLLLLRVYQPLPPLKISYLACYSQAKFLSTLLPNVELSQCARGQGDCGMNLSILPNLVEQSQVDAKQPSMGQYTYICLWLEHDLPVLSELKTRAAATVLGALEQK